MSAKFEGNPIMCLRFMEVWKFLQVCKKEGKETKKMSNFLKAYISGMTGAIHFRSGMRSLPICRHLHSKFGLVLTGDHGATNAGKVVLYSSR